MFNPLNSHTKNTSANVHLTASNYILIHNIISAPNLKKLYFISKTPVSYTEASLLWNPVYFANSMHNSVHLIKEKSHDGCTKKRTHHIP
jgi:hypothetical protein